MGTEPVIVEQDPALPYGHLAQTSTARAAVAAALVTDPQWVLYAEDDIDVDPCLVSHWPMLLRDDPVALWHRPRFTPPGLVTPAAGVVVAPAANPGRWLFSMAVILPAAVARAAVDAAPLGYGFDLHLRELWKTRGWRPYITLPCLVEHRRLPRVASRGGYVESGNYRGPRT